MVAWRRENATRVMGELRTFVDSGWYPGVGRALLRKIEKALSVEGDPVYVDLTDEDVNVLREIFEWE
jgi:hypothetical protein